MKTLRTVSLFNFWTAIFTAHKLNQKMKTPYLKKILSVMLFVSAYPVMGQTFYAAESPESGEGNLDILESSTGAAVSTTPITMTGLTVKGITGMAYDASANITYVLVKHDTVISLAQIDLLTGDLSNLVSLSEKFAGLAITPSGTMYGITGDGANTPETLYEIDKSNGNLTLNTQPGTGDDGESIAFNASNGLLYRYGGGQVFQSIDPMNSAVTDIFLSHPVSNWAHALFYDEMTNAFLFTAEDSIYALSTSGMLTGLAVLDNQDGYKGLVSTAVTGIDEGLQEVQLIAYPNPTSNVLTLSGLGYGKWQHEIIDPLGRIVLTLSTNMDQAVLDLTDLRKGHYAIVSLSEKQKAITPIVIN